jgi:stearoyl-CoA desaturase (delta-9 desaturase)
VCLGLIFLAVLCSVLRGEWIGLLTGALWGGVVRIFILEHFIWALNSVCHMVGTRRFHTRDRSRNVGLLAPFIFGEAWHHNHHAFPASAWFGMAWYRIDPGYWFICVLTWVGLAREVNVPSEEQLRDFGVNAGERG